jgi:hypothetical protein
LKRMLFPNGQKFPDWRKSPLKLTPKKRGGSPPSMTVHPTWNGLPQLLTGAQFNNSAAGLDIRVAADSCIRPQFSIFP